MLFIIKVLKMKEQLNLRPMKTERKVKSQTISSFCESLIKCCLKWHNYSFVKALQNESEHLKRDIQGEYETKGRFPDAERKRAYVFTLQRKPLSDLRW
jgi:hypothetical protein